MRLNTYYFWHDALTEDFCHELIQLGKETKFSKGVLFKGDYDEDMRKSSICFFNRETLPSWFNFIKPFIVAANNNAGWGLEISEAEDMQIAKYSKGDYYKWHIDSTGEIFEKLDKPTSPEIDGKVRKLTCVALLNDDFTGGELELKILTSMGDVKKIKPEIKKGSLLFFPSNTVHRVTPVTKGVRYSAVNWFVGQPLS
jgi:PKHD-type hydroxylase